jgi:two-component system chemotaxis response regulator CheB
MEKSPVILGCKVVIIGGSAGSLDVLLKMLPRLNAPTCAIVFVVHRKSSEDSTLEELIAIKTNIPVKEVEDKVQLLPGNIYVAPSDYHLLFEKSEMLSLDTSEKVNYSRPSIDVSFESAADVYGQSLVAILLSGANTDGTAGLHPETAEMPFMPRNAIENNTADYILGIEELLEFVNAINT